MKRNDSQVNDTVNEKSVGGTRRAREKTVMVEKSVHAEIATVSQTTNLRPYRCRMSLRL